MKQIQEQAIKDTTLRIAAENQKFKQQELNQQQQEKSQEQLLQAQQQTKQVEEERKALALEAEKRSGAYPR